MNLVSIIYYFGIAACGIQGSEKSRQQHNLFCLPASFLAALGGGMFRDLFILFVFPVAFTKDCILDITIALCAGIFYRILSRKHELQKPQNIVKQLVPITDALGLGTFIAIGIDRALAIGTSQTTALYCGIVTALGGGILSSLLCGQSVRKVLHTGITYRIITILGAYLYICCLANGVTPVAAQFGLILYTLFFIPMSTYDFEIILRKYPTNAIRYPIVRTLPIPTAIILYQIKTYPMYIPHQLLLPNSFSTSSYTRERNLLHIKCTTILLNYKILCPRRFARGR